MENNKDMKFSLRIFDDNRECLEDLINNLRYNYRTEIIDVSTNEFEFKFMLIIDDLQQSLEIDNLIKLIQSNNSLNRLVNLFVSYSSETDIAGFSFTQPMIDIISNTKCSVDVSLIFID